MSTFQLNSLKISHEYIVTNSINTPMYIINFQYLILSSYVNLVHKSTYALGVFGKHKPNCSRYCWGKLLIDSK